MIKQGLDYDSNVSCIFLQVVYGNITLNQKTPELLINIFC